MAFAIYLIVGLAWTFTVDRYSFFQLGMKPMAAQEIFIQTFFWPISILIFSISFFKEVFSKKD